MSRLTGVKAVTFDMDGTLWDFVTVMRHSLTKVLQGLERLDPQAARMLDVEGMVQIRDRVHIELKGQVTDLNDIRLEGFKRALLDVGRPNDALASHMRDVYFKHRDEGRTPYPDVRPTVSVLKERYTLGLLSNGNTLPADLGLDGLFDFSVLGQDHGGIEKPDVRIFHIALERAGCSAGELVHVGDSLENDVAGAVNAGIRSVWLNRNGGQARSTRPDFEITSLRELMGILC